MSFMGLVNSIGGKQAPPPPPPPPKATGKSTNVTIDKPTPPNGQPAQRVVPVSSSSLKRKAEDPSTHHASKIRGRPQTDSANGLRRPAAPPLNAPRPAGDKAKKLSDINTGTGKSSAAATPSPTTAAASMKKAVTSSYADMIARAKQAQQDAGANRVGVIKHETTVKERKSKLEIKRREEQAKAKSRDIKDKIHGRPLKREDEGGQKTAKVQGHKSSNATSKTSYKGTMGISTKHNRPHVNGGRRARMDEYLGTDEEDNSDIEEDEPDNYASDESSDMEAGFDDIDAEEEAALRKARADDANELAKLAKLSKEKEEKRRKLMALANKRR